MRSTLFGGLVAVLLCVGGACVLGPGGAGGPTTLEEAAALAPEGRQRASIHLVVRAAEALEQGELGTAQELVSRALRIDGHNPYAYLVLGRVAGAAGERDPALRYLEQAETLFALAPDENGVWIARALRLRAELLSETGEVDEAARLRERAERLDPGGDRPGSSPGPVLDRLP